MTNELIGLLVDATLVLSAALLGVFVLRRAWRTFFGAGNALLLWALVPIVLIATLLPAPVQTIDPAADPRARASGTVIAPMTPAARERVGRALPRRALPPIVANDAVPSAQGPSPLADPAPKKRVLAAWLTGALLMVAALVVRQHRLLRSLGRLTLRRDGTFLSEQPDIGPILIGALRPRIVLPADFEQRYTRPQQDLIVAHERCHLRRGDTQFTLVACLLRCVFWFNPLVHLAWPRFRMDQELACDAAVLRAHPGHRRAYAEAMLATRTSAPALPVGCAWRTGHPLATRIRMICAPPLGRLRLIAGTVMFLSAGTVAAIGAWSHQEPQRYYRAASMPELRVDMVVAEPTIRTPGLDRAIAPRTAPMPAYAVSTHPPPLPEPEQEQEPAASTPGTAVARSAMPAKAVESGLVAQSPTDDANRRTDIPEKTENLVAEVSAAETGTSETATVAVEHARLIETTPPDFPRSMYRPRLLSYPGMPSEGLPDEDWSPLGRLWGLLLRVRLDERGAPVEITVDDSNIDDPRLVNRYHELATAAVRDWRFAPARIDGEPVVSEVLLPFFFDTNRYDIRPISYQAIATPRFRPGPPSIGSVRRYVGR